MSDNWWEQDQVVSKAPTSSSGDNWWEGDSVVGKGETPEQKTQKLGIVEKGARATAYGLLGGAEGAMNTLGKAIGADPQKLAKVNMLIGAGKEAMGVTPEEYAPATKTAADPNATLGDRVSSIPRSIIEMGAPIAAGAALGGLPGALGTIGLTETGSTIDRVRQEDKTDPNAELTIGQKARVAGKVGTDLALGAIGGKATFGAAKPIMETGFAGFKQAATQTGKAALTDALAADASVVADKGLIEGALPSPSDLAVAAGQGALPGAAIRGPKELAGGLKARENILNALDPQSRNRINERIQGAVEAGSKDPFKAAKDDLTNELNYFKSSEGVTALTKDLESTSGYSDRTKINIENALDAVKRGDAVPPSTMKALRDALGDTYHGDNLLRLLEDHQNFNTIETKVNDGGVMGTGFGKAITPFGRWPTTGLDLGAAAVILGGHHIPYIGGVTPQLAAGLLGAQATGYAGARLTDRLTGASNVPKMLNKVSGPDVGPEIASMPYPIARQQAKDQVMAERAQRQQKPQQDAAVMAKAAKKAEEAASPSYYEAVVPGAFQDLVVRQSTKGIGKKEGWERGVHNFVGERTAALKEMADSVPASKDLLTSLEYDWTHNTKTVDGGVKWFKDMLDNSSLDEQSKQNLESIFKKHEMKLRSSWKKAQ